MSFSFEAINTLVYCKITKLTFSNIMLKFFTFGGMTKKSIQAPPPYITVIVLMRINMHIKMRYWLVNSELPVLTGNMSKFPRKLRSSNHFTGNLFPPLTSWQYSLRFLKSACISVHVSDIFKKKNLPYVMLGAQQREKKTRSHWDSGASSQVMGT